MNPMLKTAVKLATPHLLSMTRGKKRKMVARAGKWAAGRMGRKQKGTVGRLALSGLGAAVVAVPVGMWVGKKLMARGEDSRAR